MIDQVCCIQCVHVYVHVAETVNMYTVYIYARACFDVVWST